jgi:hypothetical protein
MYVKLVLTWIQRRRPSPRLSVVWKPLWFLSLSKVGESLLEVVISHLQQSLRPRWAKRMCQDPCREKKLPSGLRFATVWPSSSSSPTSSRTLSTESRITPKFQQLNWLLFHILEIRNSASAFLTDEKQVNPHLSKIKIKNLKSSSATRLCENFAIGAFFKCFHLDILLYWNGRW